MIAYIEDNKWIHLSQVTQGAEECLVTHFSVKHPRAFYIDTTSDWDGWFRKYDVSKQRLALPFLDELEICCKEGGIPLEIDDKRGAPKFPSPNPDHITDKFIEGITLDDHQVRALHVACYKEIGLFDMTTGAGKTEIICGLVKMYRCPTIIVTEQVIVLDQIVDRLELRNVVHNNDIAKFCHGERPDGNIVMVGSIQSLNSPKKPPKKAKRVTTAQAIKEGKRLAKIHHDEYDDESSMPEDLCRLPGRFPEQLVDALTENPAGVGSLKGKYLDILIQHISILYWERRRHWYKVRKKNAGHLQSLAKKCDLLMIDECDKAVSNLYSTLFRYHFNGRRRYGFSGTPFDPAKPHDALGLKERLGSVIEKAGRDELEGIGRIIPLRFYMFGFGEDGDKKDSTAFDIAEREAMIENADFHDVIIQIINKFPNDRTMILIDTTAIEELGLTLEAMIPDSKFLYNKTTKASRRKYLKMFEDGELRTLIGGKILKRGLDLKGGVNNLIICGGGKLVSNFDQMLGRAVRKNQKGYARVFDFYFLNNKYLYDHSRQRLKAVVDMGYNTTVIVGGHEIDGRQLIKSRFRIPKAHKKA